MLPGLHISIFHCSALVGLLQAHSLGEAVMGEVPVAASEAEEGGTVLQSAETQRKFL